MCGIFGHTHGKGRGNIAPSREALHTLTHRGPDQWGEFNGDDIYMGHRRLSILDLSDAGKQPMIFQRPNGKKVVLTINGEVWNFKELRGSLYRKYEFKSASDSEVVLYGYIEWGLDELLERLDGMYAFSLYDEGGDVLHIVRDRFGIKPLYYAPANASTQGRFIYASEIKAIFQSAPDLRQFSRSGTMSWTARRGSYSGLTPYHNIFKLSPGHRLEVDTKTGSYTLTQYYDIIDEIESTPSSPADLDAYFSAAVQKRLMADVSVGLQLSGGVDSSLVAAEMRALKPDAELHSFSIGFAEQREQKYSEEPHARKVAGQLGLTHHQINITRRDSADNFEHVLWLCDGMMDFPNTIPIHLLSQYSKPLVTVQLTGEGADELFGGYKKFPMMARLTKKQGQCPHALAAFIGTYIKPEWGRSLHLKARYGGDKESILNSLNNYISENTLGVKFPQTLLEEIWPNDAARQEKFNNLPFERQLLVLDHKTYLHAVLERQDRGSMGAAIESRVPFLDRDLIKFAMNAPIGTLFDQDSTKIMLKDKAAKTFGHSFAHRKKTGFPLPINSWLDAKDGLADFAQHAEHKNFLFHEDFSAMKNKQGFDRILLNYPDSESQWIKWFATILANAQNQFNITNIAE